MIKKLLFGLTAVALLSMASCGDDKKDEDKDESKSESSESKEDSKASDLCDCVDATKEAYLKGEEISEALNSKCEELFENTPNAEELLVSCENYQELMELSEKISDIETEIDEANILEGDSDATCEELIEQYEEFMKSYNEVYTVYKADPQNADAVAAYTQLSMEAAKFSTSFMGSDCMMDEEFNAKIEAITEEYGPEE